MKVVILAGGLGTRLSEETTIKPKPMVTIGGKPILWHILKHYSHYGHNEFVILLGYLGDVIKQYFSHYFFHHSDITFDLEKNAFTIHKNHSEPWKVTLVDTGLKTQTGSRLKKAAKYIQDAPFMLAYGDGVSDVNINKLKDFHHSHDGDVTMASVQPVGRFGVLDMRETGQVNNFLEKPKSDGNWINAGFFVCNPTVLDYIDDEKDDVIWEKDPLEKLTQDGQLFSFQHMGFWQCMDTLRDKTLLENYWASGNAPWKVWND